MGDDVMNTIQNCKSWARLWLLLFLGLLGGSGYGLTAQVAGIVTNCTSFGSGPGTLQAALGGGGTVTFQCSGTIIVPQITISADTKIDATGQTVTLSGNDANRVFLVNKGVKLELIQLTIRNGKVSASYGGGIYNYGTLSVTNTTLLGNSAGGGGGIYNDRGTVSVTNSTLSGNSASWGQGSGIYGYYGTLTVSNSTLSANTSPGSVIYQGYGTLTVANSTLSNNNSSPNGVIYVSRVNGTISNCTLVGNTGTGIMVYGDNTIAITNSTLSGNSSNNGTGAVYNGGNLTITNSTVSNNSGGGISNAGTLTITNSTVSGNKNSSGGGIGNGRGGSLSSLSSAAPCQIIVQASMVAASIAFGAVLSSPTVLYQVILLLGSVAVLNSTAALP
jgi:parallel beta-helix repeat protein